MIRIDDTLLEEIGLISLPKAERDQLLRQIYETLEMRVGMKLAERMSDQQLDEFERFIDTNDEAGALKWLEGNFPDYKQVVADELEKLKVEIKRDAPQLVEAIRQGGGLPSQGGAASPQPMQPQQPTMGANPQYGPAPQQQYGPQQPSYAAGAPQPMQAAPQQYPSAPQPQMMQSPDSQEAAGYANPQPSAPTPMQPYQPQQPTAQDSSFASQPQDGVQQLQDSAPQNGSIPPPPSF